MTSSGSGQQRRWQVRVVVLLAVALVIAALGAVVVGSFHREYGDINRSGWSQGLRPGLMLAILVAIPASFACALARARVPVVILSALILVGGVVGTMGATNVGVSGKQADMPQVPDCSGGNPDEETEPDKAAGVASLSAAMKPYVAVFAELPSPGHFGAGEMGVDGCGAWLVDVGVKDAYVFYLRELPAHGWTISDHAPGEMLNATRDGLTFSVGMSVTDGFPKVEVYRTDSDRLSGGQG